MYKLIVFDLDNTLAGLGKGIIPEDISLLKEIENRGNHIAICSGKPTYYLCGFMRQVGLKRPILVGENGAVIQFGVDLPPREYVILPYSEDAGNTINYLRDNIQKMIPHVWFQPNVVELTPFLTQEEEFDQIDEFLQEHTDQIRDVTIYKQVDCYDVVPNGISKASGLTALGERLGIFSEETIAVGDGINDYPMFEYAGLSVGVNVKEENRVDHNFPNSTEALKYILDLLEK